MKKSSFPLLLTSAASALGGVPTPEGDGYYFSPPVPSGMDGCPLCELRIDEKAVCIANFDEVPRAGFGRGVCVLSAGRGERPLISVFVSKGKQGYSVFFNPSCEGEPPKWAVEGPGLGRYEEFSSDGQGWPVFNGKRGVATEQVLAGVAKIKNFINAVSPNGFPFAQTPKLWRAVSQARTDLCGACDATTQKIETVMSKGHVHRQNGA